MWHTSIAFSGLYRKTPQLRINLQGAPLASSRSLAAVNPAAAPPPLLRDTKLSGGLARGAPTRGAVILFKMAANQLQLQENHICSRLCDYEHVIGNMYRYERIRACERPSFIG